MLDNSANAIHVIRFRLATRCCYQPSRTELLELERERIDHNHDLTQNANPPPDFIPPSRIEFLVSDNGAGKYGTELSCLRSVPCSLGYAPPWEILVRSGPRSRLGCGKTCDESSKHLRRSSHTPPSRSSTRWFQKYWDRRVTLHVAGCPNTFETGE